MNSPEYSELKDRMLELKGQFVDFEIPLDRNPTTEELYNIAAFKLLMHAEIETFIENRIERAIDESAVHWNSRRAISRCLFNVVVRWSDESDADLIKIQNLDGKTLDELIRRCVSRARDEIANNNSIKRDAFLRMSFSAGFVSEELEGTLLAALESFGKTRGDVAHRSAGKVRTLNAPLVEAKSAEDIVTLLAQFDLDLASVGA